MRYLLYVLSLLLLSSCSTKVFKSKWTTEQSPATFVARFETSKGNFDVQITREWSPLAADRFYQLVKHHYYDSGIFYRAIPNFVVQFGSIDTSRMKAWQNFKFADETVMHGNKKGSISFARAGKETRTTELFINLVDNPRLDTLGRTGGIVTGFPSFGDVINGMDVVSSLYTGYAETPRRSGTMYKDHKEFFKSFPQLDVIHKAYIVKK